MKIISIICVYHPDKNSRLSELVAVLSSIGSVCIFVNGGTLPLTLKKSKNLFIIDDEINYGVPNSINIAAKKFYSFEYFWLFDQDTFVNYENANLFIEIAKQSFKKNPSIAAVTSYDKKNITRLGSNSFLLAKCSTTLLNIQRINACTKYIYDKYFFMDLFDWDLCQRIFEGGGIVFQIKGPYFSHNLGDEEPTLLGIVRRPSEFRLFIQGMAFARYLFIYKKVNYISFLLIIRTCLIPFKNLLFNNSFKRTFLYFSGVFAGLRGETGSSFVANLSSVNNRNLHIR